MASPQDVFFSILAYTICSSVMLVANKVAIHHFPVPALVFAIQLWVSVLVIYFLKLTVALKVDNLTAECMKAFLPYIAAFVLGVYCNGKALQHSNVETVIVFRACTPVFVSVLDWAFLGRELPSIRSATSLAATVAGALMYVLADGEFKLHGLRAYSWVILYLLAIVVEMTYGKQLISKIDFETPVWGAVLYTNAMGLPPMVILGFMTGEMTKLNQTDIELSRVLVLLLSCAIGVGISWAGWNCRGQISATAYTLVGVCCKLISVLFNVIIWDKHATALGIFWLLVCLASGAAYQQAPLREADASSHARPPEHKLSTTLGAATGLDMDKVGVDNKGGEHAADPYDDHDHDNDTDSDLVLSQPLSTTADMGETPT